MIKSKHSLNLTYTTCARLAAIELRIIDDNSQEEFPGVVITCRLACDLFPEWILHPTQKNMLTKAAPLDNLDSCCIGNDGSDLLRHLYPTDYAGISFANSDQQSVLGDLGAACGRRKLGTPPWREAQPIELPSSLRGQKQEGHRCGRALHATKPLQNPHPWKGPSLLGLLLSPGASYQMPPAQGQRPSLQAGDAA